MRGRWCVGSAVNAAQEFPAYMLVNKKVRAKTVSCQSTQLRIKSLSGRILFPRSTAMKRALFVGVICLAAAAASAQQPPAGGQGGGQKIGIATSLQRGYAALKGNLTQAADKLPESDYTFKPSSMSEVRPYGQLFAHVANAQYNQCSAVKGVPK